MIGQPAVTAGVNVLLVEDDAGEVLITEEAPKQPLVPAALHPVRSGEQALQFLWQAGFGDAPRPALILLGINLPWPAQEDVLRAYRLAP